MCTCTYICTIKTPKHPSTNSLINQDREASESESGRPLIAPEAPKEPDGKRPEPQTEPEHVDLNDPYYETSLWTNKKEELDLDTYFHPLRPNLGQDYGISGLRPVIKDPRQGDFLLMDDDKRFYSWNPDDGRLFRVKKQGLEPGEAADLAMNGFDKRELEQMVHAPYKRT